MSNSVNSKFSGAFFFMEINNFLFIDSFEIPPTKVSIFFFMPFPLPVFVTNSVVFSFDYQRQTLSLNETSYLASRNYRTVCSKKGSVQNFKNLSL